MNGGFEFVEVTATVGVSVTVTAGNVVVAVVVLVTVTYLVSVQPDNNKITINKTLNKNISILFITITLP